MKITTIKISEENWKILTQMKLDRNFKSLNDLISSLIKEEETGGKQNEHI